MINFREARRYTDRVEDIPRYAEAMADTERTWDVHHFVETAMGWNKKQCIAHGCYYNVDPKVLIFVTRSEHERLHDRGRFRGHKHTEEERKKIGEASKRGWTPERKAKHAARMRELYYQGRILK